MQTSASQEFEGPKCSDREFRKECKLHSPRLPDKSRDQSRGQIFSLGIGAVGKNKDEGVSTT